MQVPLTASTPTAALDAAVSLRLTLEGHELSARVRGFSRAHEAPGGPRLQRAERGFDYGDVTSVHTALGWVYVSPQGINLSREFEDHAVRAPVLRAWMIWGGGRPRGNACECVGMLGDALREYLRMCVRVNVCYWCVCVDCHVNV